AHRCAAAAATAASGDPHPSRERAGRRRSSCCFRRIHPGEHILRHHPLLRSPSIAQASGAERASRVAVARPAASAASGGVFPSAYDGRTRYFRSSAG
ncbi:Os03g0667700, partial [Oryza sativa Japonica Group]